MRQCQLSCKDRPSSFDFFPTQANQGLSILVTQHTIQLYKHLDNSNSKYYNAHGKQAKESDIITCKWSIKKLFILRWCPVYLFISLLVNDYSSSFVNDPSPSPCQVIYYDCGKISSLIKVQFQSLPSDTTQLIASTISSNGLAAIWDLTQQVKPICDYINGLGIAFPRWYIYNYDYLLKWTLFLLCQRNETSTVGIPIGWTITY